MGHRLEMDSGKRHFFVGTLKSFHSKYFVEHLSITILALRNFTMSLREDATISSLQMRKKWQIQTLYSSKRCFKFLSRIFSLTDVNLLVPSVH